MRKVLLLTVVMSLCLPGLKGQSSSWEGLWRILQETEDGRETLYLLVRGGTTPPTLFSGDFNELVLSDWKVTADGLWLNWQSKGTNLAFEGSRRGETIEGTWKLLHPQYSIQNRFLAQRLFPDRTWAPLRALEDSSYSTGLVDLNTRLLKATAGDESHFRTYWRESFQPDFFPFLVSVPALRSLFETLKSREYLAKSERFVREFTKLSERVAEKFEGLKPIPGVISFPYGRAEISALVVQNREFLLVDPSLVAEGTSELEYRLSLARNLLKSSVQPFLPAAKGTAVELYREGVPGYLVWKLGYTDSVAGSLKLPAGEVDRYRKERSSFLKTLNGPAANLPRSAITYFGFDFVRSLVEKHGLNKALTLNARTIQGDFPDYVGSAPDQGH